MENSQRFFHKISAHLKAAEAYAELSRAKRLKVGAVIVKEDRIISIGFNGTPVGQSNVCEDNDGNTLPSVVHAESNAIMFAAKNGMSTKNCTLVVTHSPCFECAKMIVQCGIKHVFYRDKYRDTSSLEFLSECGVDVIQAKIISSKT